MTTLPGSEPDTYQLAAARPQRPGQRLQNRCSARPECGIMEAQARAAPGQAGRLLRLLAQLQGRPVAGSGETFRARPSVNG